VIVGAVVGFLASFVPYAFLLVLLLTCGAAFYHASRKDGKAARYWYTALGEVIGMVALVAVYVITFGAKMRR
jgi:hypothetical protein